MKLIEIDPSAELDCILRWSKGTVYLLKAKHTDLYFVSLTNTVNFGSLMDAKIFEDRDELRLQYSKIQAQFKGEWEILKLQLENL